MLGGGVGALALSLLTHEQLAPHGAPSAKAWAAFVYLIVMGSLVAFSALAWLLANTSVAVATSYAFVNPIIALFLGVFLAHETIGRSVPLAVVLVLAGLFLVLRKPAPPAHEQAPLVIPPITDAIAEYERSLVTPSRFDKWAKGDDTALTVEEHREIAKAIADGNAYTAGEVMATHVQRAMNSQLSFLEGRV